MTRIKLPNPFSLITYESIVSTNEEAKRLAKFGAPEWLVVLAKEQTSGIGRRGRKWVSEKGNLFFSVLLRPEGTAIKAMQLNYVASLCIAESLEKMLPETAIVNCKWPNDILINERKISGILIEAQTQPQGDLDWLIIGIGINVHSFPKDLEFPATSLIQEGAKRKEISAGIMLEFFCKRFLQRYDLWNKLGFAPIRKAWLCRVAWLNKRITVRLEKEILKGKFEALDKDGALILSQNGNNRRITAGDIFLY